QSGSGADIIQMLWNWPHLYANGLVDVSDVAEPLGKAQGGYYDVFEASARVAGRWLAVPHAVIGNAVAYRRSWFNEIGAKEFPKTWDEYREVGKKLKAKGKPIGQALGHSFGDPPTFAYPFLWDFGGAEVDTTGKKVAINSKGTIESVKFLQAFWKDACDEGGLAWDDTNNNRAFHAGEISATLNGASIYIVAKRQKDKIKDEKGEPLFQDIEHAALMPKGPAGQFALYGGQQHSIMKYSKNQKLAKDFLKWLHQDANYGTWFEVNEGYSVGATKKGEDHPTWAAGRAPAFAQGTKLHIVRWVDFIPEADVELKRQAPEASKALGAEVTFEFINANDLQPRITAAIQSGSGADIIQMLWNWPQLYANALVDVSDVAEPIGKAQGGYYDVFNASAKVGGKWLAVPHGCGGNAVAYRRSWFNEIGVKEFPKTWDEYREVGKKLKAKGKPVGQALGHSFGDPPVFAYACR